MFKRFNNFLVPDVYFGPIIDTSGGGAGELTTRETFKALNDDSETNPDELEDKDDATTNKPDKGKPNKETGKEEIEIVDDDDTDGDDKDGDKNDEEVDELDLLEQELEEPDEEKLELVTPVSRKQILKKYPKLFEEFPYLEKAYYREQQFTEIFPNPEDAKAAVEKTQVLDRYESDLQEGNLEPVLAAVKGEAPKSFARIVDNLMPTLAKIDPNAHTHLVGNVIKQTIMAMVQEGRRQDNQALNSAAQILNQFVFASSEFEPPKKLAPTEEPKSENSEEERYKRERQDFIRQRFNDARTDLGGRVNNSLKSTIEQNIDPNNTMTDYVRRNAIRDAQETIETLISKDKRFAVIVDKLWERAMKSNLSRESVEEIRRAYMSKAKTLLDTVIKKSRNDALRGMGKRVKDEDSDTDKNDKNTDKSPRRANSKDNDRSRSKSNSDKSTDKHGIPKSMSTLQFLMQDD